MHVNLKNPRLAGELTATLATLQEELPPEQFFWLCAGLWFDRHVLAPLLFNYFFLRRLINPRFEETMG